MDRVMGRAVRWTEGGRRAQPAVQDGESRAAAVRAVASAAALALQFERLERRIHFRTLGPDEQRE